MMVIGKRQRAMLREIGIRVWQPMPEPAAAVTPATPASPLSLANESRIAGHSGALRVRVDVTSAPFNPTKQPFQAVPATAHNVAATPHAAWRVGATQMLYADTAVQKATRWLVLLEAPSSALESNFNPLADDAGKLLDNMLRAAKLHLAGAVLLAPLVRSGTGGDLPSALVSVMASTQAHVVLVMGRLAAQALLQSTEPLARLRGQIHTVQGQQIVITIDPAYLLRNPLEKAKAWDDMCLALSVSEPVSAP